MGYLDVGGYVGKILRVNLSEGASRPEALAPDTLRKWVGGVGLGADILYREVPPGVEWSDPENRLIWTSGPLAGSGHNGAGTINVMTKGPMTNLAGSSQANGFFGAYLKFSGYDGIVFQGRAPHLSYLYRPRWKGGDPGRPAPMRAWTYGKRRTASGPTSESRKRPSACSESDPGAKTRCASPPCWGTGGTPPRTTASARSWAPRTSKAVVVGNGRRNFKVCDEENLKKINDEMLEFVKTGFAWMYNWGTGGGFSVIYGAGALPVKNLTTNLYPNHEKMNGEYLRTHFKVRPAPCHKCRVAHVKEVTVTEGPYAGFTGEEPEYEQLAAWGPMIGNEDLGSVVMLTREVDRLGLDCNESSWTIGWAMECFNKGVFTEKDTDGLDLTWGNVESVKELLNRIARREGRFGDFLADGVMRASKRLGGKAADWAVYTEKGVAPRSHDHRGRWHEFFDTCLTNTSTIESSWVGVHPHLVDLPPVEDPFSHEEVSTLLANYNGIRQFDDCLGICRLASPHPKLVLDCFNAVTGWDWTLEDAFTVGRRVVNLLRVFNFRHGMKVSDERPSRRYGSVPTDGPAQGKDIMTKWPWMVENYYTRMGWDSKTGKPLEETLRSLDLEDQIADLCW